MRIAIIGNPNCGKTTLFNRITRSNLPTGNRIGVTVEATEGRVGSDSFFDLPGIYSLENAINEESAAAAFLKGGADYILNVVDCDCLSRSLLLTSQLLTKKIPMTVLLNMTDKPRNKSTLFDVDGLSEILGCPVLLLKKNDSDYSEFFKKYDIKRHKRFSGTYAQKYAEFDSIEKSVIKRKNKRNISERLDKILFDKYLGFPIFIVIMCGLLTLISGFFGSFLGGYVNYGTALFSDFSKTALTGKIPDFFRDLLTEGIIVGAGGVLSFLPMIVGTFFLLAVLEDCGYLSRVAVLCDGIFSRFGASGKSAICIILGCGCTVPAVLSTNTLEPSERRKCLYNIHFVPCSAKLPVFTVLLSCCFDKGFWLVPLAYVIGIAAVLCGTALLGDRRESPFLLELPPLQLPYMKSVWRATKEKIRSFFSKVCGIIVLASVAVWLTLNYDFSFRACSPEDSILAKICGVIQYVFLPIGLADWRITASYIAGFAGKETIIGVLSVIGEGDPSSIFTGFTALQYALFLLISPPCAASLSAIGKELGKKELRRCLFRQLAIAYAVCAVTNLIHMVFSLF